MSQQSVLYQWTEEIRRTCSICQNPKPKRSPPSARESPKPKDADSPPPQISPVIPALYSAIPALYSPSIPALFPVISALYSVIPAKAGIPTDQQRHPHESGDKPAARNQA